MDSFNSNNKNIDEEEIDIYSSFTSAANQLTLLYKNSLNVKKQSYIRGYRDGLESVFNFIKSNNIDSLSLITEFINRERERLSNTNNNSNNSSFNKNKNNGDNINSSLDLNNNKTKEIENKNNNNNGNNSNDKNKTKANMEINKNNDNRADNSLDVRVDSFSSPPFGSVNNPFEKNSTMYIQHSNPFEILAPPAQHSSNTSLDGINNNNNSHLNKKRHYPKLVFFENYGINNTPPPNHSHSTHFSNSFHQQQNPQLYNTPDISLPNINPPDLSLDLIGENHIYKKIKPSNDQIMDI
ncbi:hypothetical protein DICPUDRAFT_155149 [Dictyostelium purpureum]|uniref:Uncharacterized protein n=1 Tax=Dictyostelium purpureum TaxID=5786 RepID=F0ZT72_DICPU|nr:uncharacterized protein DICPUDRAFT_155149 [Dictyostelium purpureum]EGC32856.1 hypothetical protein DICPUDRAFT_155149 [Dictyostelium purpureum]|eukprot:XP_003290608.1 hypothetical protein DICPUDRAFT_155149 [Dictyostelium purpureum]